MSAPRPLAPHSEKPKLLAPLWHTIVLILFVLATAYYQSHNRIENHQVTHRVALYCFMICFEWFLFAFVWFLGIRPTERKLSEVIGGRWATAKDVWRDIGAALVFWLIVAAFLLLSGLTLGQNPQMNKVLQVIMPRSAIEMVVWVLMSISAGFCEEFVFRGYLQKQFLALTGSNAAAIAAQALLFGVAHLYQGVKGLLIVSGYGALFGILAVVRKSLRPGMIQHLLQDSFAGIGVSLLAKHLSNPRSISFY
jgi:membrane protease YdiL (CAAX protease family)